jgi:HlyD family secretion protein
MARSTKIAVVFDFAVLVLTVLGLRLLKVERPGCFSPLASFLASFTTTRKIMRRWCWNVALVLFCSSIVSCSRAPEVQTTPVRRARVESVVSSVTSGTVKAEQVAELAFGTVGRVRELNVKLGDVVKKGAVLAQVENDDLLSRMKVAHEELQRSVRLSQSQAMSRSAFIQAQGNYDAARIAYDKSLIKAPYDGIIAELNLEVGQLSQITAVIPLALIRIVDLEPRYIRAEIDEVDLSKVAVGMPARVKVLAVRREPFNATVRKVVPFISSVREQDRTSEVELIVTDSVELLPPGASADVEVITAVKDGVLTVVSKAVLGRGADRYVYKLERGKAVKTPVALGIANYAVTEVVSGLSENDRVIVPSDRVDLLDGLAVREQG